MIKLYPNIRNHLIDEFTKDNFSEQSSEFSLNAPIWKLVVVEHVSKNEGSSIQEIIHSLQQIEVLNSYSPLQMLELLNFISKLNKAKLSIREMEVLKEKLKEKERDIYA